MEQAFAVAALWLGLAIVATIIANRLRISIALIEIVVGVLAAFLINGTFGDETMGANQPWLKFIASSGAILLTFLAGAELDPATLRTKWKEVWIVGMVGFLAPFLGCSAVAYWLVGWDVRPSLLAGVALSTTSMAVVYAVMLEYGFNKTDFGKGVLGACFINDLGTVIMLGLLFAPFTFRTVIFVMACVVVLGLLPFLTAKLTALYAHRTAAIRTKWVLFVLFGLGALALWSGSEAVLPAYLVGMILANAVGRDEFFARRFRTLTVGFLTPFYFLRAGSLVSLPALLAAPIVFLLLFGGKVFSKIFGLYPVLNQFKRNRKERWYYTLLMSTGLTFGTISAMYGLSHEIITQAQYSLLVAVVIASAVVPTLVANFAFLPRHLLSQVNPSMQGFVKNKQGIVHHSSKGGENV
ncbi:MAG: cation:proton antiporter [Myxococcales bacterium]|nr:cation:proton antiporter [Myxococcales bacterium]